MRKQTGTYKGMLRPRKYFNAAEKFAEQVFDDSFDITTCTGKEQEGNISHEVVFLTNNVVETLLSIKA